jgi:hypothetical protein
VRFGPAQRAWVVPRGHNFDKDAPQKDTLDFNHQVFGEDKDIVEEQYPEDLPIALQDEVHIAGDKSSIAYRLRIGGIGSRTIVYRLTPISSKFRRSKP